jgi:TonB family protein
MRLHRALIALISTALCAQDVMNQGVAAFRNANYKQAIELFGQAAALHPNDVNPHLYLGTAYMSIWIPGLDTPENNANARLAETEFKRVLELDAKSTVALASLASMSYAEAPSLQGEEKTRKLDESMDWYKRLAAVDPMNKEAPYSMGVITWTKWYPALITTRAKLQMLPADPGPLPAPEREELKAKYSTMLDEGIANLDRALQIDPQYADAMAYINLLIRERADLRETKEEYAADIAVADEWIRKNLDAKKAQAQSGIVPPAPPLPYASAGGGGGSRTPVRDGGAIQPQTVTPVKTVEPIYPPLAKQAHISGTVRFTLRIGKDGSIQNIQLISGHPLLIAAARDAVKQYIYNPVLLNGNPVEAVTQVDVHFVLNN